MLDFIFAVIAAGAGASSDGAASAQAAPTGNASVVVGSNVQIGGGVAIGGSEAGQGEAAAQSPAAGGLALLDGTSDQTTAPAEAPQTSPIQAAEPASEFNMSVVPAGLVAEPQNGTGKFTTATEIKPIMQATRGNWVAVREYGGQDLLYVTHIWGWRCGLHAMAISVNGETMQNWPLPACPYLTLKQGAVQTIEIQLVYDDLSMDRATFERGNVLIP